MIISRSWMRRVFLFSSIFMIWGQIAWGLEIEGLDDISIYMDPSKTISMDFIMADMTTVLKMFSQQSGLNFIATTDIASKRVNLYLDKVPVEEALERILSSNNLTYEIKPDSNIFIVKEIKTPDLELMTRVYPLKFATVPSSKLNSTLSSDSGSTSSYTSNSSSGILEALKSILSSNGKIVEDTRTNSLIVSDIPAQFPLIEQAIARLDVPVPQILIETEMLDISKQNSDQLGFKWNSPQMTFYGAQRKILFPFDRNKAMRNYGKSGGQGFNFSSDDGGEASGGDDSFSGEFKPGVLSFEGLGATMEFLKSQGDTKSLARPRILTLNNETAEISITSDEAVGEIVVESGDTGSETTQAERMKTGVSLKVTPQANLTTDEIVMAIEPKVISSVSKVLNGTEYRDPEERGSKSILKVRDGDTIVLGGLLRMGTAKIRTEVPFLGNIPFLGAAFRHKDEQGSERELVIFLTPHILDKQEARAEVPSTKIIREQSLPDEKGKAIDNSLSSLEKKGAGVY